MCGFSFFGIIFEHTYKLNVMLIWHTEQVSMNTNQIKIKFLIMSYLTFTSSLVDVVFFAWVLALKEEEGEMFSCQHATPDCEHT